jgi:hypothetical protein
MPMIDVYAAAGTFSDSHALARDLAAAVMRWEQVPDLPLFANNTAAFMHGLDANAISNVDGERTTCESRCSPRPESSTATNSSGSSRELTEIVAAAAGDPSLSERTCVLLTESPEGGWGIGGHADTNADIAAAARAALGVREPLQPQPLCRLRLSNRTFARCARRRRHRGLRTRDLRRFLAKRVNATT